MIFNFVMFRVVATLLAIFLFVKLWSSTDFGNSTIGGIIAAFAIPLIALYSINTYKGNSGYDKYDPYAPSDPYSKKTKYRKRKYKRRKRRK